MIKLGACPKCQRPESEHTIGPWAGVLLDWPADYICPMAPAEARAPEPPKQCFDPECNAFVRRVCEQAEADLLAAREEVATLRAAAEAFIVAAEDYRIHSETSDMEDVTRPARMIDTREQLRAVLRASQEDR